MAGVVVPSFFAFAIPGLGAYQARRQVEQMLYLGQQFRDQFLWDYPVLPGAVYTYVQMVAGREWKVSGNKRAVPRAVEYLNSAVTINSDGVIEYGFDQFERRRSLDYICVGRTQFSFQPKKSLRYLDSTGTYYDLNEKKWVYSYTGEKFEPEFVSVNHPIPIGGNGMFIAPLTSVIPTAMLAWLIREHDVASADGRKIRDIMLVIGKELSDSIDTAVKETVALWSGKSDVTKVGVPMITVNEAPAGTKAADLVTTIGLARIPEGFNRNDFTFDYVNQISSGLGLALRHFWNAEKATNRALEEVQQTRQMEKGPSAFLRAEQRNLNSGALKQFGADTRMAFDIDIDLESQKVRAMVIKNFSDSLISFAKVFNGQVNGKALLGWLQGEGILPADLDLIVDIGMIQNSDSLDTPGGDTQSQSSNGDLTSQAAVKKNTAPSTTLDQSTQKSVDDLDYDEISMNSQGEIVARRVHVVSFAKILEKSLIDNPEFIQETFDRITPDTFQDALKRARDNNLNKFVDAYEHHKSVFIGDDLKLARILYRARGKMSDNQHRDLKAMMDRIS